MFIFLVKMTKKINKSNKRSKDMFDGDLLTEGIAKTVFSFRGMFLHGFTTLFFGN